MNTSSGDPPHRLLEGQNIDQEDAFQKLQRRRAEKRQSSYTGSIASINTLLAIKDVRLRKGIATRRLRNLKRILVVLFILSFILSWVYVLLLYLMYSEDGMTLGMGLVERHVCGTAKLEFGLELWLFMISCMRMRCPRSEGVYHLTQISYVFAFLQYLIMIPLNARNFSKHLSQLEDMMMREMQLGRCSRIEVVIPSKSNYSNKYLIRDDNGCVLETRPFNLPHIRPITQIECDGDNKWYRLASNRAYDRADEEELGDIKYEVYSQTFAYSQKKHQCCGITSHKDWMVTQSVFYKDVKENGLFDDSKFIYPESCCKPEWRKKNKTANCYSDFVFGGVCTADEQVTVITFSLTLLVVLTVCGILNLIVLSLLTRYRSLVERFRPDLLDR